MPAFFTRIVVPFLRRRLFLLIFLSAGFFPVTGPAGFFLGGVLGYFLDEFLNERRKRKDTLKFLLHQDRDSLDNTEIRTLAAAVLYFTVRLAQGLPREMLGSPREELPLLSFLGESRKVRYTLERIVQDFPREMEAERITGMIIALNSLLTAGEKLEFLELTGKNLISSSISGDTARLVTRTAAIWGVPPGRIPIALTGPSPGINPWLLLGVNPGASAEEIRKNYRTLAAQFHPDTNLNLTEEQQRAANEAFMRIKQAYDTLLRAR